MTREEMIKEIAETLVNSWELDTLMEYALEKLTEDYEECSDEMLEIDYDFVINNQEENM